MSKKILKLCRDTSVVWVFDEDAAEKYGEATLIYGVSHVNKVSGDTYGIYNGNTFLGLQFGVQEVREKW